jgi:predicted N-acetyltransferase YhbS
MAAIDYQVVSPRDIDIKELFDFYQQQCHSMPGSMEKLQDMVARSCCFVTARDDGRLIGIARGVTDGLRGYLTECKLDPAYQGPAALTRTDGRIEHDAQGIGRELAMRVLESLRDMGVERIDVTAHGTEEDFCAELGFRKARGAVAMHMDPKMLALCQQVN